MFIYVISGSFARRVTVKGRTGLELVGPGQVFRPRAHQAHETIAVSMSWHVLSPSWVAVLDRPFFERIGRHPDIVQALLDRVFLRLRSLAIQLAVVGIPNLEQRLLVLLWHLADAYGRVRKQGVGLDLVLSHGVLAELVSAQRSSVSRALGQLERKGQVTRGPNRSLVLHGPTPIVDALLPVES